MNTKTLLTLAVALLLAMAASSSAAPRMWSKATGKYDDSMTHRPSAANARRSYRSMSPAISVEARTAIANAPSATRRYSYEPSQAAGHCGATQATAKSSDLPSAGQATANVRSTRRYSYEPQMRTYSTPRRRSNAPLQQSLPKADPRKYSF